MADPKPLAPFTPAPLHVTVEFDSDGYRQHTVRASNNGPLAVLSNYSVQEQKANATLYAAAPELLAALEDLLDLEPSNAHDFPGDPEKYAAARAAIAKATGSPT